MSTPPLLTISTFARSVGLSPSALRLYADHGVLVPAEVDDRTGYRYYAPEQQRRGVLVRRLRAADLSLAQVQEVLDADAAGALGVVEAHRDRLQTRWRETDGLLDEIVAGLRAEVERRSAVARVPGHGLARAIRQVRRAAERRTDSGLAGVLWDVTDGTLSLVATDRYWLAWRTVDAEVQGPAVRVVTDLAQSEQLADLARSGGVVEVDLAPGRIRLRGSVREHSTDTGADLFPDHWAVLAGVPDATTTMVLDRPGLLDALAAAEDPEAVVGLRHDETGRCSLTVADRPVRLDAVATGARTDVEFTAVYLGAAAEAGVGPDLVIELSGPNRPAVVRSAEQDRFTAVVMPRSGRNPTS